MSKNKKERIDGLSPDDVKKIRIACRKVWSWSYPRRLCLKRAIGPDGFPRCEMCGEKVAKVYADHIVPVGEIDGGFLNRLFCPSTGLQAICASCHRKKTNTDRKKMKEKIDLGF